MTPKPSKLDDPILREELIDLVVEGKTVKQACTELGIDRSVVTRYCIKDTEFARTLDRARHEMAHVLAEECVDIADTDADPQRARNRIDARKWFVATVLPKVYSPKAQIDVTIEDRTDFGARIDQARARIAQRMRALKKQEIEDAVVIEPQALPAPGGAGGEPPPPIDVTAAAEEPIKPSEPSEQNEDPFS